MHPAATYGNQGTIPRRFESVFTGVRPWCLTVVSSEASKDEMYIHSYDNDKINRLYHMDEDADFDIDKAGNVVEIEGFIETRAYSHQNPLTLKSALKRFYRLNLLQRSTRIQVFSRPEPSGEWISMWNTKHLVGRNKIVDGIFEPVNHMPQTRPFVYMPSEEFSACHAGTKFISLQYRFEFKGPIYLDSLVISAKIDANEATVYQHETEKLTLIYPYRKDYDYSINYTL